MTTFSLEALAADVRRLEGEVQRLHGLLAMPLIEKTPGVVGGSARIARTRIPVWTLESYRRQGLTDAEILDSFPTLRAVDLAAAWSYAGTHADEIARDIQENDDVLTALEAGNAGLGIPDEDVVQFAKAHGRAVLTLNRRDFIQLHARDATHAGIVVCTEDKDRPGQANRIHAAVSAAGSLAGQLIRVNRPLSG